MGERRTETRLLANRYRLGTLLGRGGAGRVYEAVDITLGRLVAVKVFRGGGHALDRYRFASEARLLASLSHPGLVTVHDVHLDGDEPFLVMRLVHGPTLRDLLDRGPFEPAAVARVGARLAEVLAHVHAHDVVHRDIKPSNVLVDEHGDCHLTDFGVARTLGAAHLTATGEFVGTAAYLAPEQVTGTEVGPGADIYSLGLLLLECLTGRTEYTGTTVETALARLNRPPHVPAGLPASWRTLLTAMTAQDPAVRPDATRCAELLHAIAHGRTTALDVLPVNLPGAPEPNRSGPPRPRAVHAGLAALTVAAACALGAGTTTVPGRPTGESRPAPETRTITESVLPATPTGAPPPATVPPPAVTGGKRGQGHEKPDMRGPGNNNGKSGHDNKNNGNGNGNGRR